MWQTWHFSFAHVRQVAAVLIVVGLSGTGTLMARASMAAVPGDTLYPIKRNLIEKVELVLAPTAQEEASVYLRHVATRLDEIRVLNERDLTTEEREQRISHTVLALNRDLTAARQSLRIAAKDRNPNQANALVAVAKGLTKRTSDVKAALGASAGKAPEGAQLAQSVNEAMTSADLATAESLDILLENEAGGQVSSDELAKLVGEAIEAADVRLQVTEKAVQVSRVQDVRSKVEQSLYAMAVDRKPTPFAMPVYDDLRPSGLTKARQQLDQARTSLKFKEFKLAVQWVDQASVTLDGVDAVLLQASNLVSLPLLPGWQPLPTSTPPATTTDPVATTTQAVGNADDPGEQILEVVESKPIVAPAKN